MKIGIIGGTGPQGKGIALRLAKNGQHEILIGSRVQKRAEDIAQNLNELGKTKNIKGFTNQSIVQKSEFLFLTVPYASIESTLGPLLEDIKKNTQILVDVTVPMEFEKGKGMTYVILPQGSSSRQVQNLVNPVPVVGALKTISAHALLDQEKPLNRDTFVFGRKEAKTSILKLISELSDLRAIDAGGLSASETVERLVPFLINLNRRYKVSDSGLKAIF